MSAFLKVSHLAKSRRLPGGFFSTRRRPVLKDVSFEIGRGEALAFLGPSGEGKSTISRILLGLEEPDSGSILIEGVEAARWRKDHPGEMSAVFQDYTSSSDPRWSVGRIIAEPLAVRGENADQAVPGLLARVGLPAELARRRPHELSGGQMQRVCIARAISTRPRFIVFDEAVSSLDASVQADILELIAGLKGGMTFLFITHDIQAAAFLCPRLLFLEGGTIAESLTLSELRHARSRCAQVLIDSALPFK
ncbi:dipeptide/oligopeptide/nickel ABC transporter ATP-binding protein [Mesosutterella sp. OilRF-GAM-744-9]|uniref:Dipeptide/oligopeptide/nickel ABC transporter ATP-binding protein n=1 Tax=Mesosutterella porci TaxID=2915351 RepID=A0ABS9MN45_9BURK|nr:dipeptide/oligopeptide/nickel ABC transporter ATP-binding protein [Mesosutterella sp. oilRF-744-WT-GAM-9]MCG5030040.1 dipeptide/oligopeptide/nickel ABC transporter ATP-binding protein [Mesosutterella sp. oilRF-744-WT-GAM-9]